MSTPTTTKPRFELKMGIATREAYGIALAELGKTNPNVVALDADLTKSTFSAKFGKEFPDRFWTVGIAEANMVSIACGLAMCGKIPFASSFAVFVIDKGYDQLRVGAAYPHVNAKFVGSHSGISIGEDGPSQMSVEDIALACALPGFVVLCPADEWSTRRIVHAMAEHHGPMFLRTARPKAAVIYSAGAARRRRHPRARDRHVHAETDRRRRDQRCGPRVRRHRHRRGALARRRTRIARRVCAGT
jgi:transketolase